MRQPQNAALSILQPPLAIDMGIKIVFEFQHLSCLLQLPFVFNRLLREPLWGRNPGYRRILWSISVNVLCFLQQPSFCSPLLGLIFFLLPRWSIFWICYELLWPIVVFELTFLKSFDLLLMLLLLFKHILSFSETSLLQHLSKRLAPTVLIFLGGLR